MSINNIDNVNNDNIISIDKYHAIELEYQLVVKQNKYARELYEFIDSYQLSEKIKTFSTTNNIPTIQYLDYLIKLSDLNYCHRHNKDTIFFCAVRNSNIFVIEKLILQKIDINQLNEANNTALILLCNKFTQYDSDRINNIIILLINNGANIYLKNNKEQNALYYCIYNNNINIITLLLTMSYNDNRFDIIDNKYDFTISSEIVVLLDNYKKNIKLS